jgi:simple sugar transport system substrate-binding protein
VSQNGPAQPTAEGQVSMITSLIPQHPTVIGVDPDDIGAAEGVLAQAQKAGIVVVSQEGATLQNTDFDLEAFNNATFGKNMMDSLATCMGGLGQYAAFVGSLTVAAHMEWVGSALAEAKAKYPGITRVGSGPFVSNESETSAYQETQQILAKYPHIKGLEGSASVDLPGIAKAVDAAGLAGKVCIVGTAEPVLAKQYIDNGTVYKGFVWDPALAGEATMYAGLMLAEHKTVGTGTNLHVPGYTDIQPCGAGTTEHCFEGNAELQLTKANIGQYNF